MGSAAYSRGSKHIREEIDGEFKERQAEINLAAEYENTFSRNERLLIEVEKLRAELVKTKKALALEVAAHQKTVAQAEHRNERHYQIVADLRRSYSDISEKLFNIKSIKSLTKHEAMLLVCEDGTFTLVHPAVGGLGAFSSLTEARQWATCHDGFIPRQAEWHDFHGSYYRVGFNIWPDEEVDCHV